MKDGLPVGKLVLDGTKTSIEEADKKYLSLDIAGNVGLDQSALIKLNLNIPSGDILNLLPIPLGDIIFKMKSMTYTAEIEKAGGKNAIALRGGNLNLESFSVAMKGNKAKAHNFDLKSSHDLRFEFNDPANWKVELPVLSALMTEGNKEMLNVNLTNPVAISILPPPDGE